MKHLVNRGQFHFPFIPIHCPIEQSRFLLFKFLLQNSHGLCIQISENHPLVLWILNLPSLPLSWGFEYPNFDQRTILLSPTQMMTIQVPISHTYPKWFDLVYFPVENFWSEPSQWSIRFHLNYYNPNIGSE